MKKTLDKNQKRNLKVVQDVCDEANFLSQKHKVNYYVIQQYENLSIFNQAEIDVWEDEYSCKKCDWIGDDLERKSGKCPKCGKKTELFLGSEFFKLIYTKKYVEPILTFEDAKLAAENSAKSKGGVWHVIKIEVKTLFRTKVQFTEVHEHYFKTHPKAKSLYSIGSEKLVSEYLISLGISRKERRKLQRKAS